MTVHTYSWAQCAAVSTQVGERRVQPQKVAMIEIRKP